MSKQTVSLIDLIKEVKDKTIKRNFNQSIELYFVLDKRRVNKADINVNELITLPHPFLEPEQVVFIATGEIALNAKKAGARVIEPEQLDRLASNKKEAKKLARNTYVFAADVTLMSRVGKVLGPILAPRGKMPTPIPQNANVDTIYKRLLSGTRARARSQYTIPVKIGNENMTANDLLDNAKAVIEALEKKLPGGKKNINNIILKLTMDKPIKARAVEVL